MAVQESRQGSICKASFFSPESTQVISGENTAVENDQMTVPQQSAPETGDGSNEKRGS